MSKSLTPTTRTLRKLAEAGWTADEVERWIPRTNIRKDLFGFGDVIAFRDDVLLIVQATVSQHGHAQERIKKIKTEPRARLWLKPRRYIQVWAWRKLKGKGWEPKITEIVLADLDVDLTQPESPVE